MNYRFWAKKKRGLARSRGPLRAPRFVKRDANNVCIRGLYGFGRLLRSQTVNSPYIFEHTFYIPGLPGESSYRINDLCLTQQYVEGRNGRRH